MMVHGRGALDLTDIPTYSRLRICSICLEKSAWSGPKRAFVISVLMRFVMAFCILMSWWMLGEILILISRHAWVQLPGTLGSNTETMCFSSKQWRQWKVGDLRVAKEEETNWETEREMVDVFAPLNVQAREVGIVYMNVQCSKYTLHFEVASAGLQR